MVKGDDIGGASFLDGLEKRGDGWLLLVGAIVKCKSIFQTAEALRELKILSQKNAMAHLPVPRFVEREQRRN